MIDNTIICSTCSAPRAIVGRQTTDNRQKKILIGQTFQRVTHWKKEEDIFEEIRCSFELDWNHRIGNKKQNPALFYLYGQ